MKMDPIRYLILLFLCLIFSESTTYTQISIKRGSSITVDGVSSAGEWADANTLQIEIQQGWNVTAYFKHDANYLYFAFNNVKTTSERFPEVLLDMDYDKNASIQDDDWWFHASYQDCDAKGKVADWGTCMSTRSGWSANNFPMAAPGFIEMAISLKMLAIYNTDNLTVGIAFNMMETYNKGTLWPSGASLNNPSSWGTGTIINKTSSLEKEFTGLPSTIKLYQNFPNPFNPRTSIVYALPHAGKIDFKIYNMLGEEIKTLYSGEQTAGTHTVEFYAGNLPSGIYIYKLNMGNSCFTKKLVLEK